METEWKPVEGYEDRYKVSNTGLVYSTPKDGKPDRLLKQEKNRKNHTTYRRVSLSKEGKVKRFLVHRLVAQAFIQNPDNKDQVNHIDHNGENNSIENLEWVTGAENMQHSHKAGRQLVGNLKKGQRAGAESKRKAHIAKVQDVVGNTYGHLKITGFKIVERKNNVTRVEVICKCIRCGTDKEVYRELNEIINHKRELQCLRCVKIHGKEIK